MFVVNYPLRYFAERVGGPQVRVNFPAPADGDPAFWRPSAEQISAYQKADLVLLNGASYAKWVPRVSLAASRIVDTSAAFADQYILLSGQTTHSHGPEGEHQHGDLAFTTWLDPVQAIAQAQAVRDVLARLRPGAAGDFQQGFAALEADLKGLDNELETLFAAGGAGPLLFSHPVYQYFVRRYGIGGHAVHWEPDEPPTAEQWHELELLLAEHPARLMVWEAKPDPSTVAELRSRGLDSVVFDPCANAPEGGDYLVVMRENVRGLSAAFSRRRP